MGKLQTGAVQMSYARRVDDNHASIVTAFERLGCWVLDLSRQGAGCPDLLVAIGPAHALALVEIKDGAKAKSRRKLTPAQKKLHDDCPALIWIIESLDDVASCVRYYRHG